MESFTLRIVFTGLCLFVPDRSGRFMHVLMPKTGRPNEPVPHPHEVEEHEVWLKGKDIAERMEGWTFDLSGLSGGIGALPKEIVNLTEFFDAKADPDNVKLLAAKVTLGAGKVTHRRGRGKWVFSDLESGVPLPPGPVYMANWAAWSVQVPGRELVLRRRPLDGGESHLFKVVEPDEDDVVCLTFSHLPPDETSDDQDVGYVAEHFHAFLTCLPDAEHRVPILIGKAWPFPDAVEAGDTDNRCIPGIPGIAYSCMIASADPT
ncbi:MAG TPA: hypothetical protein VF263_13145 [Longimicrobiaceae bacterium]